MRKFYYKISKSDIANLVKKANLNKNELNELSKKVKAISTQRLTKYLINKFSIFNDAKYFPLGIFEKLSSFYTSQKIH